MIHLPEPTGGVVALGAHADDIEIGAGGLLMTLLARYPNTELHFVVFTGEESRHAEAEQSIKALAGESATLSWLGAPDGYLPYRGPSSAKRFLVESTADTTPSLVVCPSLHDGHQDHRFVGELAWQRFRRSWIVEYQIPKWEGEVFEPNLYVPLAEATAQAKLDHLDRHFSSQHHKPWYDRALFEAQLRMWGIQCGMPLAEAFVSRKVVAV